MKKLLPERLKKGDTVGFLSACGDIKDYLKLEKAKEIFEQNGYKVKISHTAQQRKDYLSGNDEQRAKALNDFFADTEINAIVLTRGGYGAIRILDKIDYENIKKHPKIFVGYSDVTALSLMIYKKTGLITYSGAMAYSDFGNDISEYTKNSFFNSLEKETKEISIDKPELFYNGVSSGILWGGNLSTIQSLCGLDFIPNEKFIFITEDINEPVYKIDKMFTQLLNIEKFKNNITGIVLGDFSGIDNEIYFKNFFNELSENLKVPVISGIKFGHEKDKQTIPIGLNAVLDTNLGKIIINN